MVQLREFNSQNGKINIIQRMSTKHIFFGPKLLNDSTGTTVSAIYAEKLANAEGTTTEILRRWLSGEGAAVTWDILVDSLRHSDLNVVASEIEKCLI